MSLPPRATRPPHRAASGFTLVELLVTLLVAVIAAGLVLPMTGNNDASRLRGAARLLAADLDAARVGSLAHGDNPRLVVFEPPHSRYHLAAADDPDTALTNRATRKPYVVTFGQGRARPLRGVRIKRVTSGVKNRIAFGIYGQLTPATTDPATVTLARGPLRVTLTIDPTTGEVTRGDIAPVSH